MPIGLTKTWEYVGSAESWVSTVGGTGMTMAWDGTTTQGAGGSLSSSRTGKSLTGTNFWEWSGAWTALGVPANAFVMGIAVASYYYRCTAFTTGGVGNLAGPLELRSSASVLVATLVGSASFTATGATFTQVTAGSTGAFTWTGNSTYEQANTSIKLRLNNTIVTGSSNTAVVTLKQDTVSLQIAYVVKKPVPGYHQDIAWHTATLL